MRDVVEPDDDLSFVAVEGDLVVAPLRVVIGPLLDGGGRDEGAEDVRSHVL